MNAVTEPTEIKFLPKLNKRGADDLFICSASFEERCLSSPSLMGVDFLTKYAVIFNIEEPLYKKQVEKNLYRLQAELRKKTTEGIFVISCQRENPVDGIQQMASILKHRAVRDEAPGCGHIPLLQGAP